MAELFVFLPYVVLVALLSAFALHRLHLAVAARRLRVMLPVPPAELPRVLVQLPLYNERNVARRIVDAACRLDYPADRLEIQVLDDSTDGTRDVVGERVEHWRRAGRDIIHLCRSNRDGFKAGALAVGLAQSDAPFVAIFDADFVPPPDFLRRLVPHFTDPSVGMVQARWGHLNRHASLLTEAQAILLDGHFFNEHAGRAVRGCFFNFNGTAGIWRRACIEDAGGWSGRTLTEDLDLSYRAQMRGWHFVYRPDVVVPAELPVSVAAFKQQQHRWAKGALETAVHLLWPLWCQPGLRLRQRVDATLHLVANLAYPPVILVALLLPWVVLLRPQVVHSWPLWGLDAVLLFGSTLSLVAFYLRACRLGAGWRSVLYLPLAMALGAGLALNNARAVLEVMRRKRSVFCRTPKVGDRPQASRARHTWGGWQAVLEVVLGIYVAAASGMASWSHQFAGLPFLAMFAAGFLALGFGVTGRLPQLNTSASAAGKTLTPSAWPKRI